VTTATPRSELLLTLPAQAGWHLSLRAASLALGTPLIGRRSGCLVSVRVTDVDELAVRIAVETYGISAYRLRPGDGVRFPPSPTPSINPKALCGAVQGKGIAMSTTLEGRPDPRTTDAARDPRDDLERIVAAWDGLVDRLRPGGGQALTGMPRAARDRHAPIDLGIADLMRSIERDVARFYAQILLAETDWTPTTTRMPGLLAEVAQQSAHFTADDDPTMALGFCDDAHDWRTRVERALERPPAPTYLGPCPSRNCPGEIHLRAHHSMGRCPACGREVSIVEQRAFLDRELADRLLTLAEIPRALHHLGLTVPASTVRRWASGPEPALRPAVPGEALYRLAEAKSLAASRRRRTAAR